MTWLTVSVDRKIIGILDYTTVHMSLANQRVEVAILATLTWGGELQTPEFSANLFLIIIPYSGDWNVIAKTYDDLVEEKNDIRFIETM